MLSLPEYMQNFQEGCKWGIELKWHVKDIGDLIDGFDI
jgi:hypothetical protein